GMDLNLPVWLAAPVTRLLFEAGRVTRAIVRREGRELQLRRSAGVVLACRGSPYDIERRGALLPHAPTAQEHFSPPPQTDSGDGLRLAESVGGGEDGTSPHAAAWVPTSVTTRQDSSQRVMPHFIDPAKPGVIAVTTEGRPFTNEGNPYHDFVQA